MAWRSTGALAAHSRTVGTAEAIQKRDLEETNRDLPEADFSFTVERHGFDARQGH
jgi:hypothetical protein